MLLKHSKRRYVSDQSRALVDLVHTITEEKLYFRTVARTLFLPRRRTLVKVVKDANGREWGSEV